MNDYGLTELENGIRVVHREITHTKVAHIGIMLDIGSRDELPEEQGIAHFWEHMAFKGTEKRNSFHIINRLESVGGELNAYTTKEKICFYATVLTEHLDRALELLVDIVFKSTFPEKQIDRERMVILEEMSMYRDTPEDSIQDDLDEIVFPEHALGRNILGTEDTVSKFGQDDFRKFIDRNLNTTKIVVSTVGNFKEQQLNKLVKKYLTEIPYKNHTKDRDCFKPLAAQQKLVKRPISQIHVALGNHAYPISDSRRVPLFMLTNILGGPYMNSRLNMSLREKNGLVYHVEANYSSYSDTGLFSIFFATDPRNYKKSVKLVNKELDLLRSAKMSATQLDKAKQQIKGFLAMSEENNNATMLMMAKSLLDMERIPSLNDVFHQIEEIEAEQLLEIAQDIFPEEMNSLIYEPEP
ncbi:MAG: pitrilysin family protein [Cytophagales bacterium]|nr:pitrilysin family protein [Cytophagales bacterium]